jgi:L-threonylcarbamoyladenylate synthase
LDELNGRISLIVDGGATEHGIESTIVSVQEGKIALLRPGPITDEQLAEFADIVGVQVPQGISAPGQLPSHYRPATPLCLIDKADDVFSAGGSACWTTRLEIKQELCT